MLTYVLPYRGSRLCPSRCFALRVNVNRSSIQILPALCGWTKFIRYISLKLYITLPQECHTNHNLELEFMKVCVFSLWNALLRLRPNHSPHLRSISCRSCCSVKFQVTKLYTECYDCSFRRHKKEEHNLLLTFLRINDVVLKYLGQRGDSAILTRVVDESCKRIILNIVLYRLLLTTASLRMEDDESVYCACEEWHASIMSASLTWYILTLYTFTYSPIG